MATTIANYPTEDGSTRTERRVGIRVFIYVIGLHVFADFVMLLMYLGQRG
jgi:hypothetical protein